MASTGEVACLGENLLEAFFSSWLATEQTIAGKRLLVSIGGDKKEKLLEELRILEERGWELYSTPGTHDFLSKQGVASCCLFKASDEKEPNVITAITERKVDLIINIPLAPISRNLTDGYKIRRLAIDHNIPLITNLQIASAFLQCLVEVKPKKIQVKSWREYFHEGVEF